MKEKKVCLNSVQDALAEGARLAAEAAEQRRLAAGLEAQKDQARQEQYLQAVASKREELLKDGAIFKTVAAFVAEGKNFFLALREGRAYADAINTIDGLHAEYSEGFAHINSDEVMEAWTRVVVSW